MLPGSGRGPSPVPVPWNPPSFKFLPCGLPPPTEEEEEEAGAEAEEPWLLFEAETSVDLNLEAGFELNSPPERMDSAASEVSPTFPVGS